MNQPTKTITGPAGGHHNIKFFYPDDMRKLFVEAKKQDNAPAGTKRQIRLNRVQVEHSVDMLGNHQFGFIKPEVEMEEALSARFLSEFLGELAGANPKLQDLPCHGALFRKREAELEEGGVVTIDFTNVLPQTKMAEGHEVRHENKPENRMVTVTSTNPNTALPAVTMTIPGPVMHYLHEQLAPQKAPTVG